MRAHRQAWAWQDEWYGLTMEDIREFERETQLLLQQKFGGNESDNENGGNAGDTGDSDRRATDDTTGIYFELKIIIDARANMFDSLINNVESPYRRLKHIETIG